MKTALVCVSIGAVGPQGRKALDGAEQALAQAMPRAQLVRVFTSSGVREKLAAQGTRVMSVTEALDHLAREGAEQVAVQPRFLVSGREFRSLEAQVETARPRFPKLALGRPLLDSPEDACALGKILSDRYQPEPGRAVVLLGHGGGEDVQQTYGQLEAALQDLGREDMLVGTLLGEPGLPQVMERLEAGGFRQVRLTPLLVAAGNHALRNMAGEEADSWQSALTRGGFQVRCSLHGLGEDPQIQQLFVRRLLAALEELASS